MEKIILSLSQKFFIMTLLSLTPHLNRAVDQPTEEASNDKKIDIFVAMKSGNKERVKEKLEKGFDIKAINLDFETVLFNAIRFHYLDVVKYILEKDPSQIHFKNDGGYTPLFYAIQYGTLETVKYLVEHGAAIDEINEKNNNITPLFYAALFGDLEKVAYLVSKGADIHAKNAKGEDFLPMVENEEIKKYLQEAQKT